MDLGFIFKKFTSQTLLFFIFNYCVFFFFFTSLWLDIVCDSDLIIAQLRLLTHWQIKRERLLSNNNNNSRVNWLCSFKKKLVFLLACSRFFTLVTTCFSLASCFIKSVRKSTLIWQPIRWCLDKTINMKWLLVSSQMVKSVCALVLWPIKTL